MANDLPDQASERGAEQVSELFESLDVGNIVENGEFRTFLDHIPIALAISKLLRGDQRVCYVNKAFEAVMERPQSEFVGRRWSVLNGFKAAVVPNVPLDVAMLNTSEEFVGTFRQDTPPLIVEAYTGLIENEDGSENYRIVALINVTDRAGDEREELSRQIRDKDTLLKELQHRVKNNLQLVIALVRLEARNERRGDKVNLTVLAGRIESLHLLYQALSPEPSMQDIDLGHYLSQIAAAVMATYAAEGIRLDLKVDHTPASVNVALPVGLVVNELLTNSFKYAFGGQGSGVITIECLRESDDRYRVVVADDGVGLPPGVVWPMPGKIGALMTQTLRENTKADFNVESSPGNGVRVTMTFAHRAQPRSTN